MRFQQLVSWLVLTALPARSLLSEAMPEMAVRFQLAVSVHLWSLQWLVAVLKKHDSRPSSTSHAN